ncbi:uncharacterized protein LOC128228089 [Mya arenaria]|uniref:uncharacterized protein LOC128228089 n=1 Tax=Mya arenaria TaxID=6604 RepID=UPI0022E1C681|nr:uncharacterized protein LOC128228089 [Mya arenaria]
MDVYANLFRQTQELLTDAHASLKRVQKCSAAARSDAHAAHENIIKAARESLHRVLKEIEEFERSEVDDIAQYMEKIGNLQYRFGSYSRVAKMNDKKANVEQELEVTTIYLRCGREITFRQDPNAEKFISDGCIGTLLTRTGMNIVNYDSDTSLKCTVDGFEMADFNAHACKGDVGFLGHDFTDNLQAVQYIPFRSPRTLLERSWSDSSINSISDNLFYDAETDALCEKSFVPKILNCTVGSKSVDCISSITPSTHKETGPMTLYRALPLSTLIQEEPELFDFQQLSHFEANKHRTPCVIPDIVILPDGRLVLVDHYHSNIQLFDQDFKNLSEEPVSFPMGICKIDAKTIAVTLRRDREIVLFKVKEKSLEKISSLSVPCNFYLWQVAHRLDRLFTICDENNIHVIDTKGNQYSKIKSGVPTHQGFIRNFDVSDDAETLFLCERSALRCITILGETVWRITSLDLPEADRNLQHFVFEDVIYHQKRLFGSLWKAGKIAHISIDGEIVRYVVTRDLDHPRALSIGAGKLVVTQFSPNVKPTKNRTVNVYQMDLEDNPI